MLRKPTIKRVYLYTEELSYHTSEHHTRGTEDTTNKWFDNHMPELTFFAWKGKPRLNSPSFLMVHMNLLTWKLFDRMTWNAAPQDYGMGGSEA